MLRNKKIRKVDEVLSFAINFKEVLGNIPHYIQAITSTRDKEDKYEECSEVLNFDNHRKLNQILLLKKIFQTRKLKTIGSSFFSGFLKPNFIDRFLFNMLELSCGKCKKKINYNQQFYRCFECTKYCVCKKCKIDENHQHNNVNFLYLISTPRGNIVERVKKLPSCSDKIFKILKDFSHHYAIGFKANPNHPAKTSQTIWVKNLQILDDVVNLSTALEFIGMKERMFVGVISNVQYEFVIINFGCTFSNLVLVPIQRILSADEKKYIIEKTEIDCMFTTKEYLSEVIQINEKLKKKISFIILIKSNYSESREDFSEEIKVLLKEKKIYYYKDVLKIGKDIKPKKEIVKSKKNEIRTIIFTSGTVAKPKGVTWTDSGWGNQILVDIPIGFPFVGVNFTPFSHLSGRLYFMKIWSNGGRVFLNQNMNNYFEICREVNPTFLAVVPQILYFVYEKFQNYLEEEMKIQGKLNSKQENEIKLKVLKEKIRNILGNRVFVCSVFGSLLSNKLKNFVTKNMKLSMIDAYGATEVGHILTNNRVVEKKKNVKLVDVPELGYTSKDKPFPRGEIYIKQNDGVLGYYKDEDFTKTKFKENYFRSGDIGELRDGKIVIIDRMVNIKKLANGEFVSYEKIENCFVSSNLIEQIMIYSTSTSSFIIAIVIPPRNQIGSEESFLKEKIIIEMKKLAKENHFLSYEYPKDVLIGKEQFTPENGLLTVSRKLNRRKIIKEYKDEINEMFMNDNMMSIVSKLLKVDLEELKNETKTFNELGGDSLSAVLFISELRKKGLNVNFESLMKTPINELLSNTKKLEEKKTVCIENEMKKMKDLIFKLKNENKEAIRTQKEKPNEIRNIFFTGSTGFLGLFILRELLKQFDEKITIYCLVRKNSEKKIKIEDKSRIRFIYGDLGSPKLGIEEEIFIFLKKNIDLIIHNGAYVNHFLSFEDLYNVNVNSIFDVIEITCGYKPLVFVSSIAVYSNNKREEDVSNIQHDFFNGYSSTKWSCDVLLSKHYKENSCIFRPSLIGFSADGTYNEKDWLTMFLTGMIRSRMKPLANDIENSQLDLISVDFVAYSIVKFSKLRQTGVFDLSMKNCTLTEILEECEKILDEKFSQPSITTFFEKMSDQKELLPFVTMMRYNRKFFAGGFKKAGFNERFKEIMKDDAAYLEEKKSFKKKVLNGVRNLMNNLNC